MDDALVIWLNALARRRPLLRRAVGALATWLAHVEVGLMLWLAIGGRRRTALRMLLVVGVVYVASEALGQVWPRQRPFARLSNVEPLLRHTPERSFPSRHVASGLAMAAISGRQHPRVGAVMAGVACALGLSRVAAGIHYPTDVLAGAALGVIVTRYAQRT